ncbi:MAG: VWA domain-containing protein, partial [Planctomycetes bacterium]|nr:VWA domain-containing protein [Planctomycetota bacterium]
LLRALKKTRTLTRIENLLLLFLRCAFIALAAVAFAEPARLAFLPGADNDAGRPQRLIVLLDNSASMGYRAGEQTVFDLAVRRVDELGRRLAPRRDEVTIFPMWPTPAASATGASPADAEPAGSPAGDAPPAADFLTCDPDDLPRKLSQVRVSARATDLSQALERLSLFLDRPDEFFAGNRHVVIVSDMQATAWKPVLEGRALYEPLLRAVREKSGGPVALIDVGADAGEANFAVTDVNAGETAVITPLDTVEFRFTIANHSPPGTAPAQPVVRLWFGKESQNPAEQLKPLAPGESLTISWPKRWREAGQYPVRAELDADALLADNERHLIAVVADGVRVLALAEPDAAGSLAHELRFFSGALTVSDTADDGRVVPLTKVIIREEDFHRMPAAGLAVYDVVALVNVGDMSPDQVEALEQYVRLGGSLFIAAGNRVRPDFYNDMLYRGGDGILPGQLLRKVGVPRRELADPSRGWPAELDAAARDHPIIRAFEAEKKINLLTSDSARVATYFPVVPDPRAVESRRVRPILRLKAAAGPDRVVADLSHPIDRPTILIEKDVEAGKVMLFASTVNHEWNTWFAQEMWVSLLNEAMLSLARGHAGRRSLLVGEEYVRLFPPSKSRREVFVVTPRGVGEGTPLRLSPVAGAPLGGAPPASPAPSPNSGAGAVAAGETARTIAPARYALAWRGTDEPGVYRAIVRQRREAAGDGPGATTDDQPDAPGAPDPAGDAAAEWRSREELFAVNLDPRESDLRKVNFDSGRQTAPTPADALRGRYPDDFLADADPLARERSAATAPSRTWWWVALAGLVVLFLESALASRAGRPK